MACSKNRGLRTLCGSLLKRLRPQFFVAKGCGDAGMCGDPDICEDIELNNLVVQIEAHPCAMTATCAVQNKSYGVV